MHRKNNTKERQINKRVARSVRRFERLTPYGQLKFALSVERLNAAIQARFGRKEQCENGQP